MIRDTVKETGAYQKGDGTVEDNWEKASPEIIEMDINGAIATIFDIMSLLKFYTKYATNIQENLHWYDLRKTSWLLMRHPAGKKEFQS